MLSYFSKCKNVINNRPTTYIWTNVERKAAQARAYKENEEYILSLRLDDKDILGLLPAVGYIDLRETTREEVVMIIKEKISGCN